VTDTKQKLKDIGLSENVAEVWAKEFKRLNKNISNDHAEAAVRVFDSRADGGAESPLKADSPLKNQEGGDHYKQMKIQPVEFIYANHIQFLEGCVIKRVCRHRAKNGAEDIRKAIHELNLILELEYGE
tara:strand:+ start:215 stop:598 length:384 start_codon:yes stop_codon:yes gene_type:complete